MKYSCPNPKCELIPSSGPILNQVIRYGVFYRSSDSRKIKRFFCKRCRTYFSSATFSKDFLQKKRRLNIPLYRLLNSGVSQRRAAKLFGVNRKTIVRRFRILGEQSREWQEIFLKQYQEQKLDQVQFDDLETSEHTKCKPLSVALAVDPKSRKILGFQVSEMPAKGLLAKVARRKYPYRPDRRTLGWHKLLYSLKPIVKETCTFKSDENPHYPQHLLHHHPQSIHLTTKGGRGSIIGQGELKKLRYDPLFSLNHTCAMLRANLNRLFRRTWCTTKTKQGLIDHLSIYVRFHNEALTSPAELGAS